MRPSILTLTLAAACACFGACNAAPPNPPQTPSGNAAVLLQDLQRLAQQSSCQSAQQCVSLPVGAKACGGPEGYVAVSAADQEAARALAARHVAARRAENAAAPGVQSDCRLVTDPGAQCVAGRCVSGRNAAM